MIKIPNDNRRFSQPNNSDLFGNIWYTKNCNFDEEGYVKLSARAVALTSEEDDSDWGFPLAFGRHGTSDFFVASNDEPLIISISNTNLTAEIDTDSGGDPTPDLGTNTWGKWWQNRWYVVNDDASDELYYKTPSNGNWTATGVNLTNSVEHPLEVFRNRATLCIGNGNVVKQITTAHGASVDLTLPADYEVKGLSYSNNRLGIITKLSDSADGQNQEAFFFVWDGATTSAQAGFPVGSDGIKAMAPYKSSWVIITNAGQFLFFNGGGFEQITALPFFYSSYNWEADIYGEGIQPEGDLFYVSCGSELQAFGLKSEEYIQNQPAGILAFDPKVGLYHRYSPSISRVWQLQAQDSGINITNNQITRFSGTIPETGNPIKYTSSAGALIGGLQVGKIYYVIKITSSIFKLATSRQNAIDGQAIDLTSTGTTMNYFVAMNLVDYGATRVESGGAVALVRNSDFVADHLVFGGKYYDYNSTDNYDMVNFTIRGFKNIGYFVTPKLVSDGTEDNTVRGLIKYRPLKENDKIILKYKNIDILGIPVTTPQVDHHCTWTDANTLTTTCDLSEVKAYLDANEANECELEVISGGGAGQMAQITSITENAGTYTIELAEELDGAVNGYVCDIIIDNWKKLLEITSENNRGWETILVNEPSKWAKFKVEMRGVEVTIEEFQIDNKIYRE
jgi:hypothetical protein